MKRHRTWLAAGLLAVLAASACGAAEIAILGPENWDDLVAAGKEVDAIYGDYVLRNDKIVAVIAQPLPTRNANMTVRGVGGAIIDLTLRGEQNDQLSAYYPGAGRYPFVSPDKVRIVVDRQEVKLDAAGAKGKTVLFDATADPVEGKSRVTVRYTLADGTAYLQVETIYFNDSDQPLEEEPADSIRADRTFTFGSDPESFLFWADDEWFRQSYGVSAPGYEIRTAAQRATLLQFVKDGSSKITIESKKSHTVGRIVFPASGLLALRGLASEFGRVPVSKATVSVGEPTAVPHARVVLTKDGKPYGSGRTNSAGKLEFLLPHGAYESEVTSVDGRVAKGTLTSDQQEPLFVSLGKPSHVVATIVNSDGQPLPGKVSFTGKDGTTSPDWGPDSGEIAVKNVYYTHNGTFKQTIAPGKYDVIVSYGPEHDAVFTSIEVPLGGDAELKATLKRSVDTTGWISSDFHSHSSPSGDNTSSQLGRVLNLFCEQIDFAPCTEHNRIDTYVPHLKKLGIEGKMATCTGMELTGSLLPVNHQNAFPLLYKPRTQDGGAPVTDTDPVVQIERLALWDNKSDKLVQMNHPNLPQILGDRDENGEPDAGFERMFGFVDVIEVHPPQGVFSPPKKGDDGKLARNPSYHWMQMLNRGYRLSAVINTDSHYNYHESGYFRNFIRSKTDDPAKIDTMEMVHAAERGNLVVSTGPFMNVEIVALSSDGNVTRAGPGDDLAAGDSDLSLKIRVQCPNWFDINRVQVFVNGRPEQSLNFTRKTTPEKFSDETVRFEATLPLPLITDVHVIVAAIGEGLELGPVMGPNYGGKLPPVAVSNPIFIDADGSGFRANGDMLDVPLAIDPNQPISKKRGAR